MAITACLKQGKYCSPGRLSTVELISESNSTEKQIRVRFKGVAHLLLWNRLSESQETDHQTLGSRNTDFWFPAPWGWRSNNSLNETQEHLLLGPSCLFQTAHHHFSRLCDLKKMTQDDDIERITFYVSHLCYLTCGTFLSYLISDGPVKL